MSSYGEDADNYDENENAEQSGYPQYDGDMAVI